MEMILFAMLFLIVVVTFLTSRLNDNSFPFPFDRRTYVYTAAEKNFLKLIEKALGNQYRILNRVNLADVVAIRNGVSAQASQKAINNARNKYLDFVVCERDSMRLLGAIDLVDIKGKGYKVKKDWFVSGALEAASIPHVRIKVKSNYSVEEIRACIQNRILHQAASSPKIKGKVIPAPLVKARPKTTGALAPSAARAHLESNNIAARQLPNAPASALPH